MIDLKTKLVKPILVDAKEYVDKYPFLGLDNNKLSLYSETTNPSNFNVIPKQLILISCVSGETINPGDKYYDEHYSLVLIATNQSDHNIYNYKKVIVQQDHLSPEYIQKFIGEYNNGQITDIYIEMEDNKELLEEIVDNIEQICLEECDNVEDSPYYEQYCLAIKDMDNIVYNPKLTNGFITIEQYPIGGYAPGYYTNTCVTCHKGFMGDKRAIQCRNCATKIEPIIYTEQEVKEYLQKPH